RRSNNLFGRTWCARRSICSRHVSRRQKCRFNGKGDNKLFYACAQKTGCCGNRASVEALPKTVVTTRTKSPSYLLRQSLWYCLKSWLLSQRKIGHDFGGRLSLP